MDTKKIDTIERHKHVQILENCARINEHSTSYEVAQCLRDYLHATTSDYLTREKKGFSGDSEQIISFMSEDRSDFWVIIIKTEDIRKYGRDCIRAYHLSSGIDFSKVYSYPYYNLVGFCESYEALCDQSKDLLYRYDFLMSCEALVSQMQFVRSFS